jgi:hypothetical protein
MSLIRLVEQLACSADQSEDCLNRLRAKECSNEELSKDSADRTREAVRKIFVEDVSRRINLRRLDERRGLCPETGRGIKVGNEISQNYCFSFTKVPARDKLRRQP